jgi:predicted nucleotidyltransferase/predicted transcriptional regulator
MVSIDNSKSVLKPFFLKPSKSKYIREIAKECNLSYERVQHYLKELEKIKALRAEVKGKIKEYSINRNHQLILKIFSLIEMERRQEFYQKNSKLFAWTYKTVEELLSEEEMKKQVGRSKTDIKFILLFGSAARGEAKMESDIDLLIIVRNKDKKFEKYTKIIKERADALSGKEFSMHIIELDEMKRLWKKEPVYTSLWYDHIVLYGDESFWRIVLELGEPI